MLLAVVALVLSINGNSADYGRKLTKEEIRGILAETASELGYDTTVEKVDWYGFGLSGTIQDTDGYYVKKIFYSEMDYSKDARRIAYVYLQIYDHSTYPDFFLKQQYPGATKRTYTKKMCERAESIEDQVEGQTFDLLRLEGVDICHMELDVVIPQGKVGEGWRSVNLNEGFVGHYYVLVVWNVDWGDAEEPGDKASDVTPMTRALIRNLINATEFQPTVSTTTTTLPPSGLTGRITDGHKNQMPYLKLTVSFDGKKYYGLTGLDGSYQIMINNFIPDEENPKEVSLKVEFSYERDGINYYKVIDETKLVNKPVSFVKRFKLETEGDKTQDISFNLKPAPDISSTSDIEDLRHLAPIYYHTHEAIDFALMELKGKVDYKLPVDVWVGGDDGTYYSGEHGLISIDRDDAHYGSSNRPENREYHEFMHHLMCAQYNGFPVYPQHEVNHGGFLNPSTTDSFVEGFAEFMAMVISDYHADPNPEIYAGFGSFEMNYKPWAWEGTTEEIAVAGILWDLYDEHNEEGDKVTLSLQEIWSILKVKRGDFYEYYKAFREAHPDLGEEIDDIFIKHGFFADKTVGNKKRDPFEPFRDGNSNGGYDVGEYFVDYGMPPEGVLRLAFDYWMVYDEGEDIGRAANYHRGNRGMAVMIPNAFVKVNDPEIRRYRVYIHFNNPGEGDDYDYGVDVREGLIYLMPLPEDVNATITIKPDSLDYVASDIYVLTTQDYTKKYYAAPVDQGYFDSHTFNLQPTGKHLDEPYELFGGGEPSYFLDRGYMVDEGKGGGGGGYCCLPALLAILALIFQLITEIIQR